MYRLPAQTLSFPCLVKRKKSPIALDPETQNASLVPLPDSLDLATAGLRHRRQSPEAERPGVPGRPGAGGGICIGGRQGRGWYCGGRRRGAVLEVEPAVGAAVGGAGAVLAGVSCGGRRRGAVLVLEVEPAAGAAVGGGAGRI